MFWIAWKGYNNGHAISLGAIEQAEAEAYGMHGYPTAAEAQAKPNSVNALEKTQVNAWIIAANDITGNPAKDAGHAAAAAAGSVPGLSAIGDFFGRLAQASTWIRVAEVILGAGLIIVSLARLAAGTPVGQAAAKAGKAAMIL